MTNNLDTLIELIENKKNELLTKHKNDAQVVDLIEGQFKQIKTQIQIIKKFQNSNNTQRDVINQDGLTAYLTDLSDIHDQLARGRNPRRNHTIQPLLKKLPTAPFHTTTNVFGGTVNGIVRVSSPNRTEIKSGKDAVQQMSPGKIVKRYGTGNRAYVPIGRYFQDFRANLEHIHEFEDEESARINNIPVKKLTALNLVDAEWMTEGPSHQISICDECLSLNKDTGHEAEKCDHLREDNGEGEVPRWPHLKKTQKLRGFPLIEKREYNSSQRNIFDSKSHDDLLLILGEIFESIGFVDDLQVLTYAKGFTREANLGPPSARYKKSVYIEYYPHPGYVVHTQGIILKLKTIPEELITSVLNNKIIIRDVLIDIFAKKILDIIEDDPFPNKRSVFELDLILSGVIKSLELDQVTNQFDYQVALQKLTDPQFKTNFEGFINQENQTGFVAVPLNLDDYIIRIYADNISQMAITQDDIELKIRELIANSIANIAYMSAQIASGSDDNEISFFINEDNEIVIHDVPEGGNGASRLIYDYLSGPEDKIKLPKILPPNFQEIFIELLQPCSQGVIERVNFRGLANSFSNFRHNDQITYRLNEISEQRRLYPDEFGFVEQQGIENIFPVSIGKRSLPNGSQDNNKKIQEVARIQEIASICIHGCPECILLNSFNGPHLRHTEKYFVSKYLLDQYFRFCSGNISVDVNRTDEEVYNIIENHETVIISQTFDFTNNTVTPIDFESLLNKVNSFIGYKIPINETERIGKFSGLWVDCEIGDVPILRVYASIGVI